VFSGYAAAMSQLAPLLPPPSHAVLVPALVAAAGERARVRFLEFFAANIRNPHTRRAYSPAVAEFLDWCAHVGVASLGQLAPLRVAISTTTVSDGEIRDCSCFLCQEN
jgi:integrase/recombinase XerC